MQSKGNYSLILKEGWVYASVLLLILVLVHHYAGVWMAMPFWVLLAVVLFLFRDPTREIPSAPLAIVSPADGKVMVIETTRDPYLDRDAIKISVKMSFWRIYTTRSPTEGKIIERWNKSSGNSNTEQKENRFGLWIQTDEDDDIIMVMNQDNIFNSPQCYISPGERIGQGQRCGYIRFGATVEIYVPGNSKINVTVGDSVSSGVNVIATLIHKAK